MTELPQRVRIREVGPRDGFQNEPEVIPTAEKVRLIGLLVASGLQRVEVTSFVRPDVIPQLADADQVLEGIEHPEGVAYSVLIPNEKGLERALARRDRFDERRPFGPWLHRIVANRCVDLLRAERRLAAEDGVEPAVFEPDHRAGDRGLLATVECLSLERRLVVVLRYGVGMTPKQIAGALDLPVGTVNSRLARSLEQLRESFEDQRVERH